MAMGVVNHLKRFLAEQPGKEAAVPGLGVFYSGEKDGSSCILFKEVSPTDRSFLNYIAFEDNISEESARAETERWVRQILQELKSSGTVYMEGVGSFSILADRVEFVPVLNTSKPKEVEFGLEEPANGVLPQDSGNVSAESRPAPEVGKPANLSQQGSSSNQMRPVQRPVQGNKPNAVSFENRSDRGMRAVQNDQRSGKNAFRPAQGDNRQRSMRPAAPNKIVLENRRGGNNGNGGQGNNRRTVQKGPQPGGKNIFTQWWFLLCCLVVVLLIVILAIRPVRESLFGAGQLTEMESFVPASDSLMDGNAAIMPEESDAAAMDWVGKERQEEENEQIANAVISGQVQREKAESEAKAAQTRSKGVSPAQSTAKPAVQAASSASFEAQAPRLGKFYIIVGSFANKTYARNKYDKLKSEGYVPLALYMETKNMYYISVKTCATRSEAIQAKAYFQGQKKMDCWIFEAK